MADEKNEVEVNEEAKEEKWVQPTFPEDDLRLPPEVRGKPIGYVDENAPFFRPNPLDVGTVRTDGIGGQEGYNLAYYTKLFQERQNSAVYREQPEVAPLPEQPQAPEHEEEEPAKVELQTDLIEDENQEEHPVEETQPVEEVQPEVAPEPEVEPVVVESSDEAQSA